MEKQRQSNYELLRILLMVAVPLYHMMIYAGIIYMPYNDLTAEALFICSGSAIVADYAFMAMSSFFLLESKNKPVISKFLSLSAQVVFIFLIKIVTIRGILTFPEGDFYVRDFFIKGSWWFIYVYLIVLVIYPFLNRIIYSAKKWQLLVICMLLGVWFLVNGLRNDVNLLHDLIAFLFTYFVMGYLKRTDFKRYFGLQNKRSIMLSIYLIGFIVTFVVLLWAKHPSTTFMEDAAASDLVRVMVGKYSFLQCVMGIAVFLFFRSTNIKVNKWINSMAQNVFYVFLLHETVMAVFWHFGKMRTIDDVLPYASGLEVAVWSIVYILCCFVFARIIRFIYEGLMKNFIQKCIHRFCNLPIIQKIDSIYWRREASEE